MTQEEFLAKVEEGKAQVLANGGSEDDAQEWAARQMENWEAHQAQQQRQAATVGAGAEPETEDFQEGAAEESAAVAPEEAEALDTEEAEALDTDSPSEDISSESTSVQTPAFLRTQHIGHMMSQWDKGNVKKSEMAANLHFKKTGELNFDLLGTESKVAVMEELAKNAELKQLRDNSANDAEYYQELAKRDNEDRSWLEKTAFYKAFEDLFTRNQLAGESAYYEGVGDRAVRDLKKLEEKKSTMPKEEYNAEKKRLQTVKNLTGYLAYEKFLDADEASTVAAFRDLDEGETEVSSLDLVDSEGKIDFKKVKDNIGEVGDEFVKQLPNTIIAALGKGYLKIPGMLFFGAQQINEGRQTIMNEYLNEKYGEGNWGADEYLKFMHSDEQNKLMGENARTNFVAGQIGFIVDRISIRGVPGASILAKSGAATKLKGLAAKHADKIANKGVQKAIGKILGFSGNLTAEQIAEVEEETLQEIIQKSFGEKARALARGEKDKQPAAFKALEKYYDYGVPGLKHVGLGGDRDSFTREEIREIGNIRAITALTAGGTSVGGQTVRKVGATVASKITDNKLKNVQNAPNETKQKMQEKAAQMEELEQEKQTTDNPDIKEGIEKQQEELAKEISQEVDRNHAILSNLGHEAIEEYSATKRLADAARERANQPGISEDKRNRELQTAANFDAKAEEIYSRPEAQIVAEEEAAPVKMELENRIKETTQELEALDQLEAAEIAEAKEGEGSSTAKIAKIKAKNQDKRAKMIAVREQNQSKKNDLDQSLQKINPNKAKGLIDNAVTQMETINSLKPGKQKNAAISELNQSMIEVMNSPDANVAQKERAMQRLMEANGGMFENAKKKWRNRAFALDKASAFDFKNDMDGIIQETFMEMLTEFDPSKGTKFSTYLGQGFGMRVDEKVMAMSDQVSHKSREKGDRSKVATQAFKGATATQEEFMSDEDTDQGSLDEQDAAREDFSAQDKMALGRMMKIGPSRQNEILDKVVETINSPKFEKLGGDVIALEEAGRREKEGVKVREIAQAIRPEFEQQLLSSYGVEKKSELKNAIINDPSKVARMLPNSAFKGNFMGGLFRDGNIPTSQEMEAFFEGKRASRELDKLVDRVAERWIDMHLDDLVESGEADIYSFSRNRKDGEKLTNDELQKELSKSLRAGSNIPVYDTQAEWDTWAAKQKDDVSDVKGVYDRKTGAIYLNPREITADTEMHEFSHVWLDMIADKNPELYTRFEELARTSEYYNQLKADEFYSTLSEKNLLNEVLAHGIGDQSSKLFKDTKSQNLWNKWVEAFTKYMRKTFGINFDKNLGKMTLKDVYRIAAVENIAANKAQDIINGTNSYSKKIQPGDFGYDSAVKLADKDYFTEFDSLVTKETIDTLEDYLYENNEDALQEAEIEVITEIAINEGWNGEGSAYAFLDDKMGDVMDVRFNNIEKIVNLALENESKQDLANYLNEQIMESREQLGRPVSLPQVSADYLADIWMHLGNPQTSEEAWGAFSEDMRWDDAYNPGSDIHADALYDAFEQVFEDPNFQNEVMAKVAESKEKWGWNENEEEVQAKVKKPTKKQTDQLLSDLEAFAKLKEQFKDTDGPSFSRKLQPISNDEYVENLLKVPGIAANLNYDQLIGHADTLKSISRGEAIPRSQKEGMTAEQIQDRITSQTREALKGIANTAVFSEEEMDLDLGKRDFDTRNEYSNAQHIFTTLVFMSDTDARLLMNNVFDRKAGRHIDIAIAKNAHQLGEVMKKLGMPDIQADHIVEYFQTFGGRFGPQQWLKLTNAAKTVRETLGLNRPVVGRETETSPKSPTRFATKQHMKVGDYSAAKATADRNKRAVQSTAKSLAEQMRLGVPYSKQQIVSLLMGPFNAMMTDSATVRSQQVGATTSGVDFMFEHGLAKIATAQLLADAIIEHHQNPADMYTAVQDIVGETGQAIISTSFDNVIDAFGWATSMPKNWKPGDGFFGVQGLGFLHKVYNRDFAPNPYQHYLPGKGKTVGELLFGKDPETRAKFDSISSDIDNASINYELLQGLAEAKQSFSRKLKSQKTGEEFTMNELNSRFEEEQQKKNRVVDTVYDDKTDEAIRVEQDTDRAAWNMAKKIVQEKLGSINKTSRGGVIQGETLMEGEYVNENLVGEGEQYAIMDTPHVDNQLIEDMIFVEYEKLRSTMQAGDVSIDTKEAMVQRKVDQYRRRTGEEPSPTVMQDIIDNVEWQLSGNETQAEGRRSGFARRRGVDVNDQSLVDQYNEYKSRKKVEGQKGIKEGIAAKGDETVWTEDDWRRQEQQMRKSGKSSYPKGPAGFKVGREKLFADGKPLVDPTAPTTINEEVTAGFIPTEKGIKSNPIVTDQKFLDTIQKVNATTAELNAKENENPGRAVVVDLDTAITGDVRYTTPGNPEVRTMSFEDYLSKADTLSQLGASLDFSELKAPGLKKASAKNGTAEAIVLTALPHSTRNAVYQVMDALDIQAKVQFGLSGTRKVSANKVLGKWQGDKFNGVQDQAIEKNGKVTFRKKGITIDEEAIHVGRKKGESYYIMPMEMQGGQWDATKSIGGKGGFASSGDARESIGAIGKSMTPLQGLRFMERVAASSERVQRDLGKQQGTIHLLSPTGQPISYTLTGDGSTDLEFARKVYDQIAGYDGAHKDNHGVRVVTMPDLNAITKGNYRATYKVEEEIEMDAKEAVIAQLAADGYTDIATPGGQYISYSRRNTGKGDSKAAVAKKKAIKNLQGIINKSQTYVSNNSNLRKSKIDQKARELLQEEKQKLSDMLARGTENVSTQELKDVLRNVNNIIRTGKRDAKEIRDARDAQRQEVADGVSNALKKKTGREVVYKSDVKRANSFTERLKRTAKRGLVGVLSPTWNSDFYGLVDRLDLDERTQDNLINTLEDANYDFLQSKTDFVDGFNKLFSDHGVTQKEMQAKSPIIIEGEALTNDQVVRMYNHLKDPMVYEQLANAGITPEVINQVVEYVNNRPNYRSFASGVTNLYAGVKDNINYSLNQAGLKTITDRKYTDLTPQQQETLNKIYGGTVPDIVPYSPVTAEGDQTVDFASLLKGDNYDGVSVMSGNLKEKQGGGQYDWRNQSMYKDINLYASTGGPLRTAAFLPFANLTNGLMSADNMRQMSFKFGTGYTNSLRSGLNRILSGKNNINSPEWIKGIQDYINGSTMVTMFMNTRSGLLQLTSFLNFADLTANTPKWSKRVGLMSTYLLGNLHNTAIGNRKKGKTGDQYLDQAIDLIDGHAWTKDRRKGKTELDLAEAYEGSETFVGKINRKMAAPAYFLTKLGDVGAIMLGGAPWLAQQLENGVDPEVAMKMFIAKAEESQQSSRPERLGGMQAHPVGRLFLTFGNTLMQYNRKSAKALREIMKGNDVPANMRRLSYYSVAAGAIFNGLQGILPAMLVGAEEDEDEKKALEMLGRGVITNALKGSGVFGVLADTGLRIMEKLEEKGGVMSPADVSMELTKTIPNLNTKLSAVLRAMNIKPIYAADKEGDLFSPEVWRAANGLDALNIPATDMLEKVAAGQDAFNSSDDFWYSLMRMAGWDNYTLGIEGKQVTRGYGSKKKSETTIH